MCGRYDLSEAGRTLRIGDFELILAGTRPRYNIAPLQWAPVVRAGGEGPVLEELRWGLLPSWARDEKLASRCINARAESVATNPIFRNAFARRRCLVPADGYFEWQRSDRTRTPWRFVRADRQPILFAGLWEYWRGPGAEGGPGLPTFTILTTRPNAEAGRIHDRMPVIVDPDRAPLWLDTSAPRDAVLELTQPPPDGLLHAYRVSPVVNSSRNDVPECVRPRTPDEVPARSPFPAGDEPSQLTLF